MMVATPDRIVAIDKVWNVLSENAFGAGDVDDDCWADGDDEVIVEDVDDVDGKSFRVPSTEYAVENNVK